MKLFRLDTSIDPERSVSRAVADTAEAALRESVPGLDITRRDLGADPVPSTAWAGSLRAGRLPDSHWTPELRAARTTAVTLADELEEADAYLFATSLYNWGPSQYVKTWADVLMTEPRFGPRTTTIAGRPAILVVARGGDYSDEGGRAEWDHATGWLRRILGDVWGLDLRVVSTDLTLAPFREYLAHLRESSVEQQKRAHHAAGVEGERLARELRELAVPAE